MVGTVLRGLMINITLALVPAWNVAEQTVFSAQPVTGSVCRVITAFVGTVVLAVGEANRIENLMVMILPLSIWVVSTNSYLPLNSFFCQLHPNLMILLELKLLQAQRLGSGGAPCAFPYRWNGGVSIQI